MEGAQSMFCKHKRFVANLKDICPSVLAVHCVAHRHQLVVKNISYDILESLRVVIKIKSLSKHDRFFESFVLIPKYDI